MTALTDQDRADLLAPCVCGHTLNDHGDMTGCWMCPELEPPKTCDVRFEALLERGVEAIVARAVNAALDDAADTCHRAPGADHCPACPGPETPPQPTEQADPYCPWHGDRPTAYSDCSCVRARRT